MSKDTNGSKDSLATWKEVYRTPEGENDYLTARATVHRSPSGKSFRVAVTGEFKKPMRSPSYAPPPTVIRGEHYEAIARRTADQNLRHALSAAEDVGSYNERQAAMKQENRGIEETR